MPRNVAPFGNRRDQRRGRGGGQLRFDDRSRLRDHALGERDLVFDRHQAQAVFGGKVERGLDARHGRVQQERWVRPVRPVPRRSAGVGVLSSRLRAVISTNANAIVATAVAAMATHWRRVNAFTFSLSCGIGGYGSSRPRNFTSASSSAWAT